MNNITKISSIFCSVVIAASCMNTNGVSTLSQPIKTDALFVKNQNVPFPEFKKKKWDNAVIADLDQDGFQDIIITDHATAAYILWNDKGDFNKTTKLIGGDTHGIAAADYDNDGRIDIVVSKGGGGGLKPRFPTRFQVNRDRTIEALGDYEYFERSRGRAIKFLDANNDGRLEMVTSAFPLKDQKQGGNFFYTLDQNNKFVFDKYLPFARWLGFKTLVTDLNNDNDMDLVFYGGANSVLLFGNDENSFVESKDPVISTLSDVSSMSPIDFDNDGDFDLLVTRSKHEFEGKTHYNLEKQTFAFFARRNVIDYDDLVINGDLKVENLQMSYPHYDVFIGADKTLLEIDKKNKNKERNFTLTQEQASGFPKDLSKPGIYIGYLGNNTWRLGGETNSPTSAVIHNVVSNPSITEPEYLPVKMLRNDNGKFTDISELAGIDYKSQTNRSVAADINNDGWVDIVIAPVGDPALGAKPLFYMNNKGLGFKLDDSIDLVSDELGSVGHSVDAIDHDIDGDIDLILGNQRGSWQFFENQASQILTNNYIIFNIGYSPDAKVSPINAVLTASACGNTYKKMISTSSAAFSQNIDTQVHIGLGNCQSISDVLVTWSNNESVRLDKIKNINTVIPVGK